jgi:tRNA-2-methylthio-N6-dimethylallyladenosine synthase
MILVSVFFKTYGCQANVADSDALSEYLNGLGCTIAPNEQEADLIIINSCSVREKAEQKMFSYLGSLVQLKKERPYVRIGLIGCVASYRKQQVYERYDHINFVYGAKENMNAFQIYLADVIVSISTAKQLYQENKIIPVELKGQDRNIAEFVKKKSTLPSLAALKTLSAKKDDSLDENEENEIAAAVHAVHKIEKSYINIMTGCNNYCTFCIVPFTRGVEISYPIEELVARAKRDIARGAKEINLVGQNVNSYKDPATKAGFAELLEAIARLEGDFWIRYVSPHPKDMTNDVLDVMALYSPKICSWVHLPLQAGSDRVLSVMNRTYTRDKFLEQVHEIRKRMPHVTLTTDIIVGFPSETEEEYMQTREMIELVRFDHIFSFIYSPRKYTKAFAMKDSVSIEEKTARLEALQKRQQIISLERNQRLEGKTLLVLIEKPIEGGYLARTEGNVRINIHSNTPGLQNSFAYAKIEVGHVAHCSGSLVDHDAITFTTLLKEKSIKTSTQSLS